jgi:hypothetical protein
MKFSIKKYLFFLFIWIIVAYLLIQIGHRRDAEYKAKNKAFEIKCESLGGHPHILMDNGVSSVQTICLKDEGFIDLKK